MLVISVAHIGEARPLIEMLGLKQTSAIAARRVFENDRIRLVVTGMGSHNAAIGTTLAFSFPADDEMTGALNFGICGAQKGLPLGEVSHIHSIRCVSNQRSFLPDMVLNLGLPERSLETRDLPFVEGTSTSLSAELVDMEAAGFFEAARSFVSPCRIFVIKLTSDFGESCEDVRSAAPALLDTQMPAVKQLVDTIGDWLESRRRFSRDELALIEDTCRRLRLTESQHQKVLFLCRARSGMQDTSSILKSLDTFQPVTSEERRHIFEKLTDALALPLV